MTALPRGRHGLTRAEVQATQRERMFQGMAAAMAEKGYVDTSVAEIIKRAGVSRETFYQHFTSKQGCFIAAYEWATDALRAGLSGGLATTGSARDRFGVLLGHYLATLAEDPARSRLFLVEVYAAGLDTMRRRLEIHQEVIAGLAELFDARDERAHFACEALFAATVQMVTTHIMLDEPQRLMALREPLVELATSLFPEA